MANKKMFWLGILAMVLVFGMTAVGCDNGSTDSNDKGNLFTLSIAVADGSQAMGSVVITSGSPTGNAQGTSVTVTANPSANYHFVKWSNNIAGMGSVSTIVSYTFNISTNTVLFAVFAPDNGTDGIISPEGTWDTDIGTGIVEAIFSGGQTWTFTLGTDYSDSGTYTLTGNYGEIFSTTYGENIGMFALTSDSTMTMYLVSPNPVTGTFYGTKRLGNDPPTTNGKLTITGLSNYNDNYAFAHTTWEFFEKGVIMLFGGIATSSTTVEAVKITAGEVVMPIYSTPDFQSVTEFSGNITLDMDIVIMSSNVIPATWTNHPDNWVANDEVSITFTDGIATLDGGDPNIIDWDGDD
ncbi:MAG: hypothetical protein FWG99_10825 [Treponema sp.]|nr:hypothetical protein [Treponema sp.]